MGGQVGAMSEDRRVSGASLAVDRKGQVMNCLEHTRLWIIFPFLLLSWTFFFLWESPLKILLYCRYYLFSKYILMVLVQFLVGCTKKYLVTKQQQQQPGCVTWGNEWVTYGNEEVGRGEGSWEDNQFCGINRNISNFHGLNGTSLIHLLKIPFSGISLVVQWWSCFS